MSAVPYVTVGELADTLGVGTLVARCTRSALWARYEDTVEDGRGQ